MFGVVFFTVATSPYFFNPQYLVEPRMGKAIASATKQPFAVPGAFHRCHRTQYTDTVYLGAWPRWVFQHIGGFDERLAPNEDYEFNYRIRKAGGHIYLSHTIQSLYFGRQTLRALAQQYFCYGEAKTLTLKKHPASLRPRQIAAPGFLAMLLLGLPSAFIAPPLFEGWLIMLITYLAANLLFSLAAARQAGYALFWRIPLVFLTIHLAWGAGFWVGLFLRRERYLPHKKAPVFQVSLSKDA